MNVAYGYPLLSAPPAQDMINGTNLAQIAAAAEGAGFSALALTDHPAPLQKWRVSGGHDAVDPFVGLAFAAAATTRLRLLTYLIVLPYRNPFLLAKSVASLDALSGGRVELGLGAGYLRGEFKALGVDFDERNVLFDEALTILKHIWSGEPVTYDGHHFRAEDVAAQPTPVQRPHPPLWLGGNSKLTRRRVVEYGTGWLPLPNAQATVRRLRSPALETVQDLAAMLADMRARAAETGRPAPERVMYFLENADTADGFRQHLELAKQVADLGITWLSVNGHGRTVQEATDWIERYRDAVLQHLPGS